MSKLFFDPHINLSKLEKVIKDVAESEEERHELWQIVDELIHHHVLGCVFDNLPAEYHDEFLQRYHNNPADELLIHFINTKASVDFTEILDNELQNLQNSLLPEILSGSTELVE